MNITDHLTIELNRYFPSIGTPTDIVITYDNDAEIITATITYPDIRPVELATLTYVCEIGSDDDWYTFKCDDGVIITVPLMNEEA